MIHALTVTDETLEAKMVFWNMLRGRSFLIDFILNRDMSTSKTNLLNTTKGQAGMIAAQSQR